MGNSAETKVGDWVLAIGSPFGFENSVTAGIVSAKARALPDESLVPFIQTDVAVNPGNSGGPLFNMKGEVIGINSQIFSHTGGYQGLSFAVPVEVAVQGAGTTRRTWQGHARPDGRHHPERQPGAGRILRFEQADGRAGQLGGERQSRRKGAVSNRAT